MPKPAAPKGKAVAAVPKGPPALYEEALSGPPLVVALPAPAAVAAADIAGREGALTGGARWGHAALLSPNEAVLCIVGGTPCNPALDAAPVWEYLCLTAAAAQPVASNSKSAALSASGPAARTWQAGSVSPPVIIGAIRQGTNTASEPHEWPLFASWWASWSPGSSADGPSALYADGGWSGARRLSGVRVFAAAGSATPTTARSRPRSRQPSRSRVPSRSRAASSAAPPPCTRRSHHTVVCVQGRLYRFGGETQQGTAASLAEVEGGAAYIDERPRAEAERRSVVSVDIADTNIAALRSGLQVAEAPAAPPVGPPPRLGPPPPRAAHGACALNQRYLVVVGGRHVQTPTDDTDAAGGAAGGKGAKGKKSTTARTPSPAKRGGSPGRDARTSPSVGDAALSAAATVTALKDVAVYDARLEAWLPVRVVGGGAVPCARYAAAVTAVPAPGAASPSSRHRGPAADAVHREVLVVGGLDAAGSVCSDAWVMQILSGTDGELAEVPAGAAADPTTAALPVVRVRWVRLEVPAAALAASPFQRHHAAAVASSQRLAYLVGGCGPNAAAVPPVIALALPPLTGATVRASDELSGDGDGASLGQTPASAKGHPASTN